MLLPPKKLRAAKMEQRKTDQANIERLLSAWEQAWKDVGQNFEVDSTRLKEQVTFFEDKLRVERSKLATLFTALEREQQQELERRIGAIRNGFGKTIELLDTLISSRSSLEQVASALKKVTTTQLPLHELRSPSVSMKEIDTSMERFTRFYEEWQRIRDRAPPPPAQKRRLISRARSKLRGLIRRRERAPKEMLSVDRQYQSGLEGRLWEVAMQIVSYLRLLMEQMLMDAKVKVDQQTVAKRALLEQKSGIAQLQTSLTVSRLALERHNLVLHKERLQAFERKDELLQELKTATDRVEAQEQLIERTELQQKAAAAPSAAAAATVRRRRYPAPGSNTFAEQLRKLYPDLYMGPTSVEQGSGCGDLAPGQIPPIKPYQKLFPRLLTPDAPYRGFLAYRGVGSGKTRDGWETIANWFGDNISKSGEAGAAVLVLLPSDKLIGTWLREARSYVNPAQFSVREYSRSQNTAVVELNAAAGGPIGPAYVILHKITVLLDDTAFRLIKTTSGGEFETVTGYHLATYDYTSHPAYRSLTADERLMLQRSLEEQKRAVLRLDKIAVPSKGLTIIEEAHNAPNPAEIAVSVDRSTTTLAWCNLLKQAKDVRLLELTATPLLDDNKMTDLFKLLNLIQPDPNRQIFEGTWRRALASVEPAEVKAASLKADALESAYLQSLLFDAQTGQWLPGMKQTLQSNYAGLVSYVTLSADPTVYPQLSNECQRLGNSSCTAKYNPQRNSFDDVQEGPKPTTGQNVLVPMNAHQYKEMRKAMQTDLSNWSERRRLDADPAKPSFADLNFGGPTRTHKSSLFASWGMKTYRKGGIVEWPNKLKALLLLMKDKHPKDKFFVYTSSLDQVFAKNVSQYFRDVAKYEVIDIPKLARFINAHPTLRTGAQLAENWISDAASAKRILLFIGSASAVAEYAPAVIGKVRDMMLELFNHSENLNGEYFQAFFGDRTSKEGLSLFHVMHVVFIEPAANPTMQAQAEARVLRMCALRKFPMQRWNQIQLWRFISIPPTSGGGARSKKNSKTTRETNEQLHYRYMVSRRPASQLILQALKEDAIDCYLFKDYNQDPEVTACSGGPGPGFGFGLGFGARDRYCYAANYLLLQDETSPTLTEFSLTTVNAAALRPSSSFERSCQLANAPVISLGAPSHRDWLLYQSLLTNPPFRPSPGGILAVQAIFGALADPDRSINLRRDMSLWHLVAQLPASHRASLGSFLRDRLDRIPAEDRSKIEGLAEQILNWMKLDGQRTQVLRTLAEFLLERPSLQAFLRPTVRDESIGGTPMIPNTKAPLGVPTLLVTGIGPRVMLEPSAPPRSGGGSGTSLRVRLRR
jgi:hypothetical protein